MTRLVRNFGQTGLPLTGGIVLAVAFLVLAFEPSWWLAPPAVVAVGLGFYMLHNTLQTIATQMTPEARGTAVAIFASAIYLGQTAGVAVSGLLFDRFTAVPAFVASGVGLLALAVWYSRALGRHVSKRGSGR